MRSFLFSFLISLFSLLLPSCGFTPVYGDHGAGSPGVQAKFDQVSIENIPDQSGVILRNNLLDRLYQNGEPADPQYILKVAPIAERETDLDITPSSTATRAEMRLLTTIVLRDRTTKKELMRRDLIAIGSYNILGSEFTTLMAKQHVRENALDDLAQQIETQLALYFNRAP
jgi:LPS-assembly lipoprotein